MEIVVASFITLLIAASALAIFNETLWGWSRGTSKAYAETSASVALQKLAQEIRPALSASIASGQLVAVMPQQRTGAHGEVTYNRSATGETRRYYVSGGELKRSVDGVVSTVLTRVSSATFTVAGTTVNISVTGTEQVGRVTTTKQFTTRVQLRNCGA